MFSLGSDWNKHMRRRIPEDTYSISYLRKGSQEVLILLSYHKVSDDGVLKKLPGPLKTLKNKTQGKLCRSLLSPCNNSIGWYWLILGATGSVWSGTG